MTFMYAKDRCIECWGTESLNLVHKPNKTLGLLCDKCLNYKNQRRRRSLTTGHGYTIERLTSQTGFVVQLEERRSH